jgi:hypothetical protein
MTTGTSLGKELTGAIPLLAFVTNGIIIVVTAEFCSELCQCHAVRFFGIASGFLDLAD